MRRVTICCLSVFVMSLIAPFAWGDSEGIVSWKTRMQSACTEHFAKRLSPWEGLSESNRHRLASAICEDPRIFWPFADSQSRLSEMLEGLHRKKQDAKPGALVIGLIGASVQETNETIAGLQHLFYPQSQKVLQWTGDFNQLHNWRQDPQGGLFGGVLVNSGPVEPALELFGHTEFDSYVLVMTAPQESRRPQFKKRSRNDSVRWVTFQAPKTACEDELRI